MPCTAHQVIAAIRAAAVVVDEHRDELVDLDRAIGDGDHGENMRRGFTAVVPKLDSPLQTPGAVLKLVASTLISTVGGAAGPLYGTAFLRAGAAVGQVDELGPESIVVALEAALGGVVARGKAEVGDKTMVDALAAAVTSAKQRLVDGADAGVLDAAAVLEAAATGAADGAESTVPLIARKGRASYLGARSAGHLDPGARSTSLLLRSFADSAADRSSPA
jgi:dihydroxyacetone kinase-like protein